jgi:hypothetical protein
MHPSRFAKGGCRRSAASVMMASTENLDLRELPVRLVLPVLLVYLE